MTQSALIDPQHWRVAATGNRMQSGGLGLLPLQNEVVLVIVSDNQTLLKMVCGYLLEDLAVWQMHTALSVEEAR